MYESGNKIFREDTGSELSRTNGDLTDGVRLYLTKSVYPEAGCSEARKRAIRKKAKLFVIKDGVMFLKKKKKGKVVELRFIRTLGEQLDILKACRLDPTAGHMGERKTIARITERFIWKGVVNDVKKMIATCDVCQKQKITQTPELHPVPVKAPWFHIGIDFVGPICVSQSGNRYILTISDYFTKFGEAIPLPDKTAVGVAAALFKIFMRMGLPRLITTDNGKEFKNELDDQLARLLRIKRILTTPYHPQANGLDERYNQTLQRMLVKFVHHKQEVWDDYLDTCVYAYNTSVHASTAYSPFELMFGRKALLPVDIEVDQKKT